MPNLFIAPTDRRDDTRDDAIRIHAQLIIALDMIDATYYLGDFIGERERSTP